MRHPLQGAQVGLEDYRKMPLRQHAWGWLAGALWALGTAANFAASYLPLIGPATAFALGEGNTMISALWGVLVWKEFRGANRRVRILIFLCSSALPPDWRRLPWRRSSTDPFTPSESIKHTTNRHPRSSNFHQANKADPRNVKFLEMAGIGSGRKRSCECGFNGHVRRVPYWVSVLAFGDRRPDKSPAL